MRAGVDDEVYIGVSEGSAATVGGRGAVTCAPGVGKVHPGMNKTLMRDMIQRTIITFCIHDTTS